MWDLPFIDPASVAPQPAAPRRASSGGPLESQFDQQATPVTRAVFAAVLQHLAPQVSDEAAREREEAENLVSRLEAAAGALAAAAARKSGGSEKSPRKHPPAACCDCIHCGIFR